ncbi:hypothetical protein J4205_00180 [Candidatus Pacearchaeota archaeon]|nr:hypothetical protein [Candidatus Pacearchaeota archaeon]
MLNKKGITRQELLVGIIVLLVLMGIVLISYFLLGDRLTGYLQTAKDFLRFGR